MKLKPIKRKPRWLDRSLLTSPAYYTLCLTEAHYHAELKKLKVPRENWSPFTEGGAPATMHTLVSSDDALCCIVTLKPSERSSLIQVYALLVHEAVHIWQRVKRYMGEDNPGDESEAYAIQRIAQSLMYEFCEQQGIKT